MISRGCIFFVSLHRPLIPKERVPELAPALKGKSITVRDSIELAKALVLLGHWLPLRQVLPIGVAGPYKIGSVVDHLRAQIVIQLFKRPPALIHVAKEIPQVRRMICLEFIAREGPVKEESIYRLPVLPDIALCPTVRQFKNQIRHKILGGNANHDRHIQVRPLLSDILRKIRNNGAVNAGL